MDNSYPEGLQNTIVDIFDMVLKDGPVLPPHALSQLEPQLFLKIGAKLCSTNGVPVCAVPVYLIPSTELFHGNTISRLEGPRVPVQPPSLFLAHQQDLSKKSVLILSVCAQCT